MLELKPIKYNFIHGRSQVNNSRNLLGLHCTFSLFNLKKKKKCSVNLFTFLLMENR